VPADRLHQPQKGKKERSHRKKLDCFFLFFVFFFFVGGGFVFVCFRPPSEIVDVNRPNAWRDGVERE